MLGYYSIILFYSALRKTLFFLQALPKWPLVTRCVTPGLKLGTAEPEVLLKRFISDNIQSPVYKAILELGRAVRTIYVCRYLSSKELRIEVEEALNVIENWNSGNNFVFFGKRGVISSNDEIDQELSVLCLHLLQSSLVYINTLMQQQVLKTDEWQHRLILEDNTNCNN
ncbi:Tn3 family transposase [Candidatus Tisiphia endosymbiont of Metellina segmentata]|uniref:Tn3 family transposase n=1 Tax=Candidatus Tisiphia endosymbiont of Metellina segmentata TaxID=3066274 RepID=UPI00313E3951